jgi:hypothetical protein
VDCPDCDTVVCIDGFIHGVEEKMIQKTTVGLSNFGVDMDQRVSVGDYNDDKAQRQHAWEDI